MLVLPVKRKWFDMILSGVKKDEYRVIKSYWTSRFRKHFDFEDENRQAWVMFRNGYSANSPSFRALARLNMAEDVRNGAVRAH